MSKQLAAGAAVVLAMKLSSCRRSECALVLLHVPPALQALPKLYMTGGRRKRFSPQILMQHAVHRAVCTAACCPLPAMRCAVLTHEQERTCSYSRCTLHLLLLLPLVQTSSRWASSL